MLWLLAGLACRPADCDSGYADQDGDGFGAGPLQDCVAGDSLSLVQGDCDDHDPEVHPGAQEAPADGTDSDCDGLELCYVDQDGDGHGIDLLWESEQLDCASLGVPDCDDADPHTYPSAEEIPGNATDNDCDGFELCYEDQDGDGVGSSLTRESPRLDCSLNGQVSITGDCEDSDPAVHPFAGEVPVDGVDGNCDGLELCYLDQDGDDWAGTETHLSESISCSGPKDGLYRYDCDDSEPLVNPGLSEVCGDGLDNDCSGEYAECGPYGALFMTGADLLLFGERGQSAGIHLLADDFSGDGQIDLLIGSRGESEAGAAYLHVGPLRTSAFVESDADQALWASNTVGLLGRPSASGDLNDDGQTDLVLYGYNPPYADAYGDGSVYLLFGPLTSSKAADTHAGHDWWSDGSSAARHGSALLIDDLDNDGVQDLLVGAHGDSSSSYLGGAVYLYLGPMSAPNTSSGGEAALTWTGDTEDAVGDSLASGDLNGDGIEDLVVGASKDTSQNGSVFVLYGPPTQGSLKLVADLQLNGSGSEEAGAELLIADWNGDGNPELAVGAPAYSLNTGRVYILDSLSAGAIGSVASATLTGAGTESSAGTAMSTGCDVNGDGSPDLVLGSRSLTKAGRATLILGDSWSGALDVEVISSTQVRDSSDARDVGQAVLCMPDSNGDGFGELVVAAPEALGGSGIVSLWFGGGH